MEMKICGVRMTFDTITVYLLICCFSDCVASFAYRNNCYKDASFLQKSKHKKRKHKRKVTKVSSESSSSGAEGSSGTEDEALNSSLLQR